jgi:hypothetical protein
MGHHVSTMIIENSKELEITNESGPATDRD